MTISVIHTNGVNKTNNNNNCNSSSTSSCSHNINNISNNSSSTSSSSNATSFTAAARGYTNSSSSINNNNTNKTTTSTSCSSSSNGHHHHNCNLSPSSSTSTSASPPRSSSKAMAFVQNSSSAATIAATTTPFTSTNLFQLLSIVCLCLLCYYNSTQCGLVFDDISAIRDNKDLRPTTPLRQIFLNDFWGTPMRKEHSHKSYRPLTVLTFRFNYWLHELQPYGYHVINVLLHIAVCLLWKRASRLLVWQCTQRDSLAQKCSFISSLLFAVHPIHTEAVTGVVGRAELLSSLFFLAAFLSYSSAVSHNSCSPSKFSKLKCKTHWLTLCMQFTLCLVASMLCKEQGITIAGICMAYELFVVQNIHPMQLWHTLLNLFEERSATSSAQTPSPTNKAAKNAIIASLHLNASHATTSSSAPSLSATNSSANITTSASHSQSLLSTRVHVFKPILWSASLVKRLTFLVCITICLLVGRVYVMGSQLPVFTRFDNPASAADAPQRQLTYSYLIYLNSWLLLFPCDLCCDWTMGK